MRHAGDKCLTDQEGIENGRVILLKIFEDWHCHCHPRVYWQMVNMVRDDKESNSDRLGRWTWR